MTVSRLQPHDQLERIHSRGYWRVLIHPSEFDAQRIDTLAQCWNIVESAKVNLRWSLTYPTVNPESRVNGNDWVQSTADWYGPDLWRFYRSGQFVHHFGVFEDWVSWETGSNLNARVDQFEGNSTLNTFDALFTITEILEFAGRLAFREVLTPSAYISIELHGMEGRRLVPPKGAKMQFGPYVSGVDVISWEGTIFPTDLMSRSDELAREATAHVFECFNWHNPSRRLLAEGQLQLRERRLP